MRLRCIFCASAMALAFAMPLYAGTPKKDNPPPAATDPKQAIERGLQFLEKDAAKWRKEKQCATCHHGVMTVWAFAEAQIQGYKIAPELVADVTKWTKERLTDIDKPRDTRPGWKMVNTPAMYLANMALAIPKQEALSADELKQIAGHLLRHQEGDGSWAWSSAPAKNRPPPHFESDEVATLLASMALGPHAASDLNRESPARDSREKASAWLAKNKPGDDTQAALLRLVRDARAGKPRKELDAAIDRLVARQNKDGGWGQLKDLPSDAYATGQTLYYLRLADAKEDRPEIQKAVAYLTKTQSEDGSWPMKSRAHPGEKPFTNPVPITYFGSAWATMGLMRSVILPSGTASAQDEKPAKEMITKEAQAAIDAGIAYLAKQQMDDGAWGTRQYPKNVGITSFAGLAFLSAGHRPGQGPPPGDVVAKAIDYVLKCGEQKHIQLPAGFLVQDRSLASPMYSHGYAVWFLAEAHAVVKGDKQKAVKDALTRGVKIIVDAQNSQGGWRYRPDPKDADLSVTACQIHALFAAMKAGVEVPEETLDNAIRYVRSCHDGKEGFFRYQPQGSKSNTPLALTGGAVSALAVAKAGEDEPWKRGVAFLKAAQPANSGRDTSHHPNYYYGQF